jgi:hypothetical protein
MVIGISGLTGTLISSAADKKTDSKDNYVHNHAYLPEGWLFMPRTDSFISDNVKQMKKYSIEYQFNNIGTLKEDGTIDMNQIQEFGHWIKVSRETDPNQKIIAWINGNTVKHVHGGTEIRNHIVNSLKNMIETGFLYNGTYYKVDGIQFDLEPLRARWKDDPELLSLLQAVRQAVGPKVHLSIATTVWDNVWSNDYISKIAGVVDMLNPMIYDTQGPDSWKPWITRTGQEYEQLWKNTALRYSAAIAASNNPNCQLAPTMPAYDKRGYWDTDPSSPDYNTYIVYHDPYIENIYHAARGLKQAISEGAKVYNSGIFYWENFIINGPDPRDNQDYSHARGWWLTEWVHNSESHDIPALLNLVQNGSFQSGKSYWEDWGNVDIVPIKGKDDAKIGIKEGGMGQVILDNIGAGTRLTLSAMGKVENLGDEVQVGIDCLNNNPGAGGQNKIPGGKFILKFTGTDYESKTLDFTTVTGTTKIQVYIYRVPKDGKSGYGYVSGISLKPTLPD